MTSRRKPLLAALVVAVLLSPLAVVVFQVVDNAAEADQKIDVISDASLLKARIDGIINYGVTMARAINALVESNPDFTTEEFNSFLSSIHPENTPVSHVAVAPDLVVKFIYPLPGNERAIGLNYRENEDQREVVMETIREQDFMLAGPLELVQGGQALVLRYPLYRNGHSETPRDLWGVLAVVIDYERFLTHTQIRQMQNYYNLQLVGKDARGGKGETFINSIPADINGSPMDILIPLPNGSWQLKIMPASGWGLLPSQEMTLTALLVLAVFLAALTAYRILLHYADIRRMNRELTRANKLLQKKNDEISQINDDLITYEYAISNAMRVPARQIRDTSRILSDQATEKTWQPKDSLRWLDVIEKRSLELLSLMEDLGVLRKTITSKMNVSEFNASNTVEVVLQKLSESNGRLRRTYSVEPDMILRYDPGMLRLCLHKILEFLEVIEHGGNPEVRVSKLASTDHGLKIVADEAALTSRDIDKLFAPFFNFHHRDSFIGSELGLFIASRIVEAHGGQMRAEQYQETGLQVLLMLDTGTGQKETSRTK